MDKAAGAFSSSSESIKHPILCLNTLLIPNITYEKWLTFEKVR
jgi:hypothetical protein